MSILKIDHIGIAVKDLEAASGIYERLLGKPAYKTEIVASEKVETAFFETGESKVELLGATDEESVIAKYITKKGEGIHHIAFEVADIRSAITRLKQEGFDFIAEEPKPGADNKLICFLHPKKTTGVLIELCQDNSAGSKL